MLNPGRARSRQTLTGASRRREAPEDVLSHVWTWPGDPPEKLIRADMVYFETPNNGAVFSVGSITFCGSLSHGGYRNNISRIVDNVLRRFATA